MNFEKELLKLEQELKSKTYQLKSYVCFAITDPKLREVWVADFRDRIIHHLLINYLESIWEGKFIFHSYACRQDKGVHKAIHYLRKTIAHKFGFYLQVDVHSFFTSIDKNILYSLINQHTKNPNILWLCQKIIFHNPTSNYSIRGNKKLLDSIPRHKSLFLNPETKGLPIGNLTSQFFANLYLNELDQFVKHKLKCHHYFRYMDDLIIIHSSKSQLLAWRDKISYFLKKHLELKLHPKKQTLQPVVNGIDFLGYITRPDYLLSRRRIVSSLKQKLYYFNKMLDETTNFKQDKSRNLQLPLSYSDELPSLNFILKTQAVINSYYGHFKHSNCFHLKKKLYYEHFKELKSFLEPADKKFSHFVIKQTIKECHPELVKKSNSSTSSP